MNEEIRASFWTHKMTDRWNDKCGSVDVRAGERYKYLKGPAPKDLDRLKRVVNPLYFESRKILGALDSQFRQPLMWSLTLKVRPFSLKFSIALHFLTFSKVKTIILG